MNDLETLVKMYKESPKFIEFEYEQWAKKTGDLVYQYRDLQSFWKIIQSDSLWATNARYCNDSQEQKLGEEIFSLFEQGEGSKIDDVYLLCFCAENDKLSQWRGYAPNGGVAIGFDFCRMTRRFMIEGANDIFYAMVSPICYFNKELISSNEEVIKYEFNSQPRKYIPYIKHSGFREENEFRIVFRNDNGELNDLVRYRDGFNGAYKIPYIVVNPVRDNKNDVEIIRVNLYDEKEEKRVIGALRNALIGKRTEVNHCLKRDKDETLNEYFCKNCELCQWGRNSINEINKENIIEECRNKQSGSCDYAFGVVSSSEKQEIFIGAGKNQKEIAEIVRGVLNEFNLQKEIKIWCEGHLPIREITVGPCQNQDEVCEMIEFYKKHTYWLNDVSVNKSNIPYRKTY